jgi:uncharacterized membrane protein
MGLFWIPIVVIAALLPWITVVLVIANRQEIRRLRTRIERLERGGASIEPPAAADSPAVATARAVSTPAAPRIDAPTAASHPAPRASSPRSRERLEEQIGGIWMQNVGSVLLLLGAFFLIVWGYANGRIGPEVLVLAGVALGIVVSWRGSVIGRSLVALGNAFIGVGLGVIYITLYLGHFRMHVFPGWMAFLLLAAVSLVTVAIGLRRREPIIATLGVVAAYLPQLLSVWIPLQGFRLPPPVLLGYFAVVNVLVFWLAATVGWSGLVLLSLLLTTGTWSANAGAPWSLGIQLGLSTLFTALGLAPVARLARSPHPVRSVDLAVVAAAPMLLLASSWPFLASPDRVRSALLLTGLAAVYALISFWVDARRPARDLWRPLTAAAAVFLAAAIERGLLPSYLALAWCAEGAALVWLGLGPGRGWLRFLGYGVLAIAAVRLALVLVTAGTPVIPTLLSGASLRDLLCLLVFLLVCDVVGRRKDLLESSERHVPGVGAFVSNALLMIWIAREAGQLRHFIPGDEGTDGIVAVTLTAAAWLLQAVVLFWLALRRDAPALRHVGYAVAGSATLALVTGHAARDPWSPGSPPLLNTAALIVASAIALLIAGGEILARQRSRLARWELRTPEVATAAANLMLLLWWAREAGHLASVVAGAAAVEASRGVAAAGLAVRTLAAVFTSAAWTLQAVALFALGWLRSSAFLRWSGLALFGLTVLKFILFDLDRVDAFWRFVSALGIGAALLVVSFLYQRKARRSAPSSTA